jgi:hypothetical protein
MPFFVVCLVFAALGFEFSLALARQALYRLSRFTSPDLAILRCS